MPQRLRPAVLALLALGFASCANNPPPGGDAGGGSGKGSISGTIGPGRVKPARAEVVPGEVIVKLRTAAALRAALPFGRASATAVRRIGPWQDVHLYRGATMTATETLDAVAALRRDPDVLWAEPNYVERPTKTPNDPFYKLQWHYDMFNLPAAWDVTTGSAATVVAVIDTGMLYSDADQAKTHPDLAGKVVAGYDFISDPEMAGDGDGRDADAFDVGDEPNGQPSYHGTHVAGTIAAATDNGTGVAGIDWSAKLVNVRVLGVGGGTSADIADGILWAAGLPVSGVPNNPQPAKVINMSLGGMGACSQLYQDAFTQASANGAIVVVAAGNDNMDASGFRPASCSGVITVGAVGPEGTRAPYSNFGARVDVMAPGGDTDRTFTVGADTYQAGVLSTLRNAAKGEFEYTFYQGTSMAAPHVAGLVSLMVGQTPSLTTAQALAQLKASARKLTDAQCNRPSGDECGAGLVDAAKALGSTAAPPPPAPPATAAAKTYVVALFDRGGGSFDEARSKYVAVVVGDAAVPYSIKDLDPGTYVVAAFTDLNGDQNVQDNEPITVDKTPVTVAADMDSPGIDLVLAADSP